MYKSMGVKRVGADRQAWASGQSEDSKLGTALRGKDRCLRATSETSGAA